MESGNKLVFHLKDETGKYRMVQNFQFTFNNETDDVNFENMRSTINGIIGLYKKLFHGHYKLFGEDSNIPFSIKLGRTITSYFQNDISWVDIHYTSKKYDKLEYDILKNYNYITIENRREEDPPNIDQKFVDAVINCTDKIDLSTGVKEILLCWDKEKDIQILFEGSDIKWNKSLHETLNGADISQTTVICNTVPVKIYDITNQVDQKIQKSRSINSLFHHGAHFGEIKPKLMICQ